MEIVEAIHHRKSIRAFKSGFSHILRSLRYTGNAYGMLSGNNLP
jgi:hypothetical protein